ncbi:MAG: 3-hydroxyacyl-CoA dehydrogenase family protein [Ferruginibacter sp.]
MKVVINTNDAKFDELVSSANEVEWHRVLGTGNMCKEPADLYMNLDEDAYNQIYNTVKPVLINSVIVTLKEISAPINFIRMNGWNSFLKNETWEIAGTNNETIDKFFRLMHKKIINCADEPGFISAKIISMIINEAFYAKQDKVSVPAEIDTAMKLGTNHPYGPFEWSLIIGKKNIYELLQKLAATEERYIPASVLNE